MPRSTILVKPVAALVTLTSGGSAGKKGPCAHIGGSLASWFGRIIRLDPEMQKRMVACGVSAGFASVFGTARRRDLRYRNAGHRARSP